MDIYEHICSLCRWYDEERNICIRPPELMLSLESCSIDDYNRELYIKSILENSEILREGDKV